MTSLTGFLAKRSRSSMLYFLMTSARGLTELLKPSRDLPTLTRRYITMKG